MHAPIYILSGGQSRRFGSDKARAMVGQQRLIEHVARSLEDWASSLFVVAQRDGQYDDLGFQTLGDVEPHLGPLGGLFTALSHHKGREDREESDQGPWLGLVSCDMAGVQGRWLEELWAHRGDALAVAFGPQPDAPQARWDPLCGLYRVELLPLVERQLGAGQRAMWKLLEAAEARALPHPDDWHQMTSINTPEALEAHLQKRQP